MYDSLILCFICNREANIGLVKARSEQLAAALTEGLNDVKDLLDVAEEEEI